MGFIWIIGAIASAAFFTYVYKNEFRPRWADKNDDRGHFLFICILCIIAWPVVWIVYGLYLISKWIFPDETEE